MTIFPFGAAVCHDCKAPVAIVRRTAEMVCDYCDGCDVFHDDNTHSHILRIVSVVDQEGIRHECAHA
jgi:hypothetical protein